LTVGAQHLCFIMKREIFTFNRMVCLLAISWCSLLSAEAQTTTSKRVIAVAGVETASNTNNRHMLADIARFELIRMDTFQVLDRYDHTQRTTPENNTACYSLPCLKSFGEANKADLVLFGHVSDLGKSYVVAFRLVETKSGQIVAASAREFMYLSEEIPNMVRVTVQHLFGRVQNKQLEATLLTSNELQASYVLSRIDVLNLSGPRMGFANAVGPNVAILRAPFSEGGFEGRPFMFQFGYQFEMRYINERKVQGLFEIVPMLSGLDQNMFLPSLVIMNGVRHNKFGLEFAAGPSFMANRIARGYFDNGKWKLENEWNGPGANPNPLVRRLDSRGAYELSTQMVVSVGKTFRAGGMNFPVNAFYVPGLNGNARYGLSLGFNARNRKNDKLSRD
jgi:TolB-like protein